MLYYTVVHIEIIQACRDIGYTAAFYLNFVSMIFYQKPILSLSLSLSLSLPPSPSPSLSPSLSLSLSPSPSLSPVTLVRMTYWAVSCLLLVCSVIFVTSLIYTTQQTARCKQLTSPLHIRCIMASEHRRDLTVKTVKVLHYIHVLFREYYIFEL